MITKLKGLTSVLIFTLFFVSCGNKNSTLIKNVSPKENHAFTCDYAGITRSFLEYAPAKAPKGIILMLHGYGSDAQAFRLSTKLDEEAIKRGFVVIYVTGLKNEQDKTSATGWNSGIGNSTNDDIGFLKELACYFQKKYNLSRQNTFAAGFSNGGFMMYRLAIEAQDTFAAVASVAGMMPESMWALKKKKANISLLQINGTKDDVVPMQLNGSSKYSKAPAIEEVMDYFITANGLTQKQTQQLSSTAELTKFSGKNNQVWQVLIQDGRHSWPEEKICGFSTNNLILDFFMSLQ